jgi:hypothetical protein
MSEPPIFSTEGRGSPLFPPHGRTQWRIDGQLLRSESVGPFNRELAELVGEGLREAFSFLVQRGPFAEIAVIHRSAMAGPEVLAALTQGLLSLVEAGLVPRATAFVMAPEVEGHQLMPALLQRSYDQAGWPAFQVFDTVDAAEAWVRTLLIAN